MQLTSAVEDTVMGPVSAVFSFCSEKPRACVLSHFSRCLTCATPGTVARQAPLSMGFSRQGYWSGLPFPPPGDLPMPGMEPTSLLSPALAGKFFTTSATWAATQILKRQESDTGWLTARYHIYCVSSTTSVRDSIWGHTLMQTTPGKVVLVIHGLPR